MSVQQRLSDQMTRAQALAYQPKMYEPDLPQAEAARRIEALKKEIELADSF